VVGLAPSKGKFEGSEKKTRKGKGTPVWVLKKKGQNKRDRVPEKKGKKVSLKKRSKGKEKISGGEGKRRVGPKKSVTKKTKGWWYVMRVKRDLIKGGDAEH